MRWSALVPRRRSLEDERGRLSSFRWLGFGWDQLISKHGHKLTQWGRKAPLRFICRYKKETPIFLLSSKWEKHVVRPGLVAGVTHAPLEVAKLWRKVDEACAASQTAARILR